MPKVVSGVAGAKAFATDGTVQNIPDITNRQGAKNALQIAVGKALEAREKAVEPSSGQTSGGPPGPAAPPAAQPEQKIAETAEDPNEGVDPSDMDLAERARKSIARKHRELKKAQADLGKAQMDLTDTDNFAKSNYARALAAEERVETLQRELEGLKGKAPEPPAVVTKAKPQVKDFYNENKEFDLEKYTEAVGAWSAEQALAENKAAQDKAAKEQAEKQMEEARQKAFEIAKKRTEEQKKAYPDWDQVVSSTPIQLHPLIGAYIQASPHIGHLGYYLFKHPGYVESLQKMNPVDAVGELGELCIRWKAKPSQNDTKPAVKEEIKPPEPITILPGMGVSGHQSDPAKMTPAQLRQYDREREVAKKRRA